MFFVGHYRVTAVIFWAIGLSQRLARTISHTELHSLHWQDAQGAALQAYTCKAAV
jgi:hypothetical protein